MICGGNDYEESSIIFSFACSACFFDGLWKREQNSIASVHLDNLSQYKRGESTLEKRNGKYVITARASYDEANKRDNSLPVHAVGLTFEYGNIWCYEDRTYLQYTNTDNSEITEISYQNYYWDSGQWEKIVDESFVEQPAKME